MATKCECWWGTYDQILILVMVWSLAKYVTCRNKAGRDRISTAISWFVLHFVATVLSALWPTPICTITESRWLATFIAIKWVYTTIGDHTFNSISCKINENTLFPKIKCIVYDLNEWRQDLVLLVKYWILSKIKTLTAIESLPLT